MNVLVRLPDDFAARFGSREDLGRHVLEVLVLAEYQAGRLSRPELQDLLGFTTRVRLDGFLKSHGVVDAMTMKEFEQDLRDMESISP